MSVVMLELKSTNETKVTIDSVDIVNEDEELIDRHECCHSDDSVKLALLSISHVLDLRN